MMSQPSSFCVPKWPSRRKPSLRQETDKGESTIVDDLNALSVKEREAIYEEIHGIHDKIQESPEFLEDCRAKLKLEIGKIALKKRKAYDRAVFLKPTLVDDRPFQLMFLRAVHYDPALAAKRIVEYFENKKMLWGEGKLAKKLTLADLDDGDMEALLSGSKFPLTEADRRGRTIWYTDIKSHDPIEYESRCSISKKADLESFARQSWYLYMSCIEESEYNQIHGMVEILTAYDVTPLVRKSGMEFLSKYGKILDGLPMRFGAVHYRHDDSFLDVVMKSFERIMGKRHRVRFRSHFGTKLETAYSLLTFGILLPANIGTNEFSSKHMAEYLQDRQSKEKLLEEEEARALQRAGVDAFHPTPLDVLLGKGHPNHTFPGTLMMHELVDDHLQEYNSATWYMGKTNLAMSIVKKIQSRGGRFLKRTPKGWVQVEDSLARSRVNNALRMRETSSASRIPKTATGKGGGKTTAAAAAKPTASISTTPFVHRQEGENEDDDFLTDLYEDVRSKRRRI